MKMITLRCFTIALVLALTATCVYATHIPGHKHSDRDQHNNAGNNAQRPIHDHADADTRHNPPGIPTNGNNAGLNPAATPVPGQNWAPGQGINNGPPPIVPARPDRPVNIGASPQPGQGAVAAPAGTPVANPQGGNNGSPPPRPSPDTKPGQQPQNAQPKRVPRALVDANKAQPPINNDAVADTRNNPVPAVGGNPPAGIPQAQPGQGVVAAPAGQGIAPTPPQKNTKPARKLSDANNAQPKPIAPGQLSDQRPDPPPSAFDKQVFPQKLVDRFDPMANDVIQYNGTLIFDGKNAYLDENGTLSTKAGDKPVGELLGRGSSSSVHKSSDPKFVKKIVLIGPVNSMLPDQLENQATIITEQNGGRAILNAIHKKSLLDQSKSSLNKLFSVAELSEQKIITAIATDIDGKQHEYRFVMSREQNIASPVLTEDGREVFGGSDTETSLTASNAEERVKKRNQKLSKAEELTINLVIRELNDYGIVWTDHKAANLDIVRDPQSPTGYKVIFFDFDGFRPVKGGTPQKRAEVARQYQKDFDNPVLPSQEVVTNGESDHGWALMVRRVQASYRKNFPDEAKRLDAANTPIDIDKVVFDNTAFDGMPVITVATPRENIDREHYLFYNGIDDKLFKSKVVEFNGNKRDTSKPVLFAPKNTPKP